MLPAYHISFYFHISSFLELFKCIMPRNQYLLCLCFHRVLGIVLVLWKEIKLCYISFYTMLMLTRQARFLVVCLVLIKFATFIFLMKNQAVKHRPKNRKAQSHFSFLLLPLAPWNKVQGEVAEIHPYEMGRLLKNAIHRQ